MTNGEETHYAHEPFLVSRVPTREAVDAVAKGARRQFHSMGKGESRGEPASEWASDELHAWVFGQRAFRTLTPLQGGAFTILPADA